MQAILNQPQQEAVEHIEGPMLVLAGAGSGKTRVITYRVAYLIEQGINPYHILAITFTNKAAGEVRERVDDLIGYGSESVWVSTFHSLCVRILRRHIERIGFASNFTIYDTDDQKRLIKEVTRQLQLDPKMYPERTLMSAIAKAKENFISPREYDLQAQGDYRKMQMARVYAEYQKRLHSNNALDLTICSIRPCSCFRIVRMCWSSIRSGSVILWWMSIRIQMRSSSCWCVSWPENTGISAW